MTEPAIRQELESHVADLVDEYVAAGVPADEAKRRAEKTFGDVAVLEQEVASVHGSTHPLMLTALWLGLVYLVLVSVSLIALQQQNASTAAAIVERVGLSAVHLLILSAAWLVSRWIIEFYGLGRTRALWVGLAFSTMLGLAITAVLDIDDFEINFHALIFTLIVGVMTHVFWTRLSLQVRRWAIVGVGMITTWAALNSYALLGVFGAPRCFYITPDAIPVTPAIAACHQASWQSPALLPFYPVILLSIVAIGIFLVQYWRSKGTMQLRKVSLTGMFFLLPVIPAFVHDINNYGAVDVIPWKQTIIQAYQEILGRDPEAKDFEFYARTRSYNQMGRVKDVLYRSAERRIKVNLVYRQTLGREATENEINRWVEERISVADLRQRLLSQ